MYEVSLWHAGTVCEEYLELWTAWAHCCHSTHLYKKQSNILKLFAGSAFLTSTARTLLTSAFEYNKNIRGLSVGFPSTLLCEHLNLFARQFLCVYCRCWPQKVLQSWIHWNVKQSSMAYRWFQWTKQVVFVKRKITIQKEKPVSDDYLSFFFYLWINCHTSFFLMNICYHPRSLYILTVLVHSWLFSGRPCRHQLLQKEQRYGATLRIPFVRKEYMGKKQTSYPTVLPLRVHPKAHAWMEFLLLAM